MFLYVFGLLWGTVQRELTGTLLWIAIVAAIVRFAQTWRDTLDLPPGPIGLPVIGLLPKAKGNYHDFFTSLAKKYGSLYSTRLGSQLIIVLSDYKLIREAFRKEVFTGRPINEFTNILGGYGIINTEGKLWKDQRRFIHDRLRQFGMSYIGSRKAQMESRIMREVDSFLSFLRSSKNEAIDLNHHFQVAISNVICDIIMSVRFSHDDSRFKRMMNLIEEGFRLFGSIDLVQFIPLMKYLPKSRNIRQKISENRAEMGIFLQETIDDHRKSFDPTKIRDLLDAYLLEIEKANEEGTGKHLFEGKDHDRQIQQIMGDLFSAGMETIKSTLQWGVLFMLHNPKWMKAVQDELRAVVGHKRLPTLEDLKYLPLTEATIYEILRVSSVVPMGTTHSPIRDVNMSGYKFPRQSQVIPLLRAVHTDPNLWDRPEEFNPMRFITAEGKVTKPEYFMPFGVGRRTCLGEVLARMELFLFFSSLLHCFDLEVPSGEDLPSLEGFYGVTITPRPFKICLKERRVEWDDIQPVKTHGFH
ncbi:cytochrome P450 18a1 [Onthophagus taurus]|uniref:cytochrome P450 18a1 n=1 Tax=Onthophagus taurus TaxID=166361 RepID=UPI000C202777|nr:cytochrome P450 18a1 [Onthophagus taurus]XP_022914920.1 cytochrome P450 18a1-like [Onthophagus taurus]